MASAPTVDFDPDAYLKAHQEKAVADAGDFNPDAYLAGNVPVPKASPEADAGVPWSAVEVPTPWGGSFSPVQAAETVKNLGLEGGGATLGQIAGAPLAEFGGVQAGGAIGGFLGNTAAQLTTPSKSFKLGEALAAGAAGMVPGASLAKAGAKTVAKQAAKYAAANVGATNIQSLVDTGKPASLGQDLTAVGAGALSAPLSKYIDRGIREGETAIKAGNASVERASLEGGRSLGLVVPPAAVAPNAVNNGLQSFGGKASVAQETLLRNQPKVDSIVRKSLGIPEGTAISPQSLNTQKVAPYLVYEEVAKMTPASDGLLSAFKAANAEANAQYGMFRSELSRGVYRPDIKQAADAKNFEALSFRKALDKEASSIKNGAEIMERFDSAKERLAKIGLAEEGLRKGNGKIDATVFGDAFEDNPNRLTGDYKKLGAFQSAFGKYVKDATNVPPSGVDWLKMMGRVGAGGGLGYAIGGAPGAVAGVAALGAAEKGSRSLILSPFYQNRFAQPFYGPITEDVIAGTARLGTMQAGREN